MLDVGFCRCIFSDWGSCLYFVECFCHEKVLDFSNVFFFCSTEVIMHFLSFYGYRVLQELISVKGKTCQRRNHRSKTVSLMLKPMIPNLDLICKLIAAMSFTRNVISINPFGIFLSTPFPIGRRGCSLPTKRSPGLKLSCHFFC